MELKVGAAMNAVLVHFVVQLKPGCNVLATIGQLCGIDQICCDEVSLCRTVKNKFSSMKSLYTAEICSSEPSFE